MGAIVAPRFKWMQREARRLAAAYDASTLWGSTPYCWLRADTVTTATGVSQYTDKSGNGRHFVQGTGSKQPALVAAGSDPNGFGCVVSDGTDDSLTNAAFGAMSSGYTLYVVTRSIVIPGATGYLISNGNLADVQSVSLIVPSAGALQARYRSPTSTVSIGNLGANEVLTSSNIRISVFSGDTITAGASMWNLRTRLGMIGSSSGSATSGSVSNFAAGLFADKAGTGSYLAAGLYEAIWIDGVHTTEQMWLGELMLAGYYALL